MKRILRWVLVVVMCLGLSVPAWADGIKVSDSITLDFTYHWLDLESLTYTFDSGDSYLYVKQYSDKGASIRFLSDTPFSGHTSYKNQTFSSNYSSDFHFYTAGWGTTCTIDFSNLDPRIIVVPADYPKDPEYYAQEFGLGVGSSGGSSGENSDYIYDSTIPAPQNLKLDFLETKVGILGLSKRTDLQLSWSNALVDEYSVQISAAITMEFTPGEGNQTHGKKTFTHKLVGLSQLDSGGSDAGFPASTGKYTITEDELKDIAEKQLGDGPYVLERAYVDSFRVQFYKIDSGVVNVGPIGVVNLSYSILGKYQGSTTTIEYPKDASDVGTGGLMPDDSGLWGGDGSGLEYDENGNITGSTGGSGSGSASWSDALKNLLDGLVNIPTIISRLFDSLTSMLSGVSQFPALLGSLFSFLPQEIISLIGLGLLVVIVLRIVGR